MKHGQFNRWENDSWEIVHHPLWSLVDDEMILTRRSFDAATCFELNKFTTTSWTSLAAWTGGGGWFFSLVSEKRFIAHRQGVEEARKIRQIFTGEWNDQTVERVEENKTFIEQKWTRHFHIFLLIFVPVVAHLGVGGWDDWRGHKLTVDRRADLLD